MKNNMMPIRSDYTRLERKILQKAADATGRSARAFQKYATLAMAREINREQGKDDE